MRWLPLTRQMKMVLNVILFATNGYLTTQISFLLLNIKIAKEISLQYRCYHLCETNNSYILPFIKLIQGLEDQLIDQY